MKYTELKDAIDTLLTTNADGIYAVIGAHKRVCDATSLTLPQVTTYIESGDFLKSKGSSIGPFGHDIQIKIDISVVSPSYADMDVLQNPDSTAAKIAEALAASSEASANADAQFDIVIEKIWNLIMLNPMFGLEEDPNRWISGWSKQVPSPRGSLIFLNGQITISATVFELPESVIPTEGRIIESVMELTARRVDGHSR